VWAGRTLRYGETTEAFTLFSIWLLILSVETVVRVIEALAEYNRINPPLRTAAVGTLLLVTWWPGFYEIRNLRVRVDPDRVKLEDLWAERIKGATDPESLLITDTPEQLAWKTGRHTVWLPATPSLLESLEKRPARMAVVLSGSVQSALDVDPKWWDLFEAGAGTGDFTEVLLDKETYCQVWKKPDSAPRSP